MLKKLGLAIISLVAATSIAAYAAGNFGLWPILNGASYCASLENTSATCTNTVPAGPTALTGIETIPADTNAAQGIQPQTILIQPRSLGAGPYQYNAPLTGASLTLTASQRRLILEPAGTIATLTVTFPAATGLVDNQLMGLCTTQIVTALTLSAGSGTTILNGPTALLVPVATGAASCVEWVYRASNTSWYRVQ